MEVSTASVRRATAAEWAARALPMPFSEFGFDMTNKLLKLGDGASRWNDIPVWADLSDIPHAATDVAEDADEASMLARSADGGASAGDISVRLDLEVPFVYDGTAWIQLPTGSGAGAVASVDGRTGTVTLGDLYDAHGAADAAVGALASVAGSGEYDDLSGRPDLSLLATDDYVDGKVATLDAELHEVAKSGDYTDLENKPAIPDPAAAVAAGIAAHVDAAPAHNPPSAALPAASPAVAGNQPILIGGTAANIATATLANNHTARINAIEAALKAHGILPA